MEAITLIVHLLEKVSVLVATALSLMLLRPAEVWLTETGQRASLRRRLFLIMVFAPLSIWGLFLGFEWGGMSFNVRAVGITVAGFLGGVGVGSSVGVICGLACLLLVPDELLVYVSAASVMDGAVAGLWARRFGTGMRAVALGALATQLVHHIVLGGLLLALDFDVAVKIAANIPLHVAKVTAIMIGVTLFMGLLSLVRERDRAFQEALASQAMVRSARLEALQYQLRPHFLFNLLNTLAYLIRTDPIKARETTLDLAAFLRYTLTRTDQETTLGQELEQIARYVDLERARFGDELRFHAPDPPEDLRDGLPVPPLILQPLVENAILHGARDGRVRVEVQVSRDADGMIRIAVCDDGPGPPEQTAHTLPVDEPTPGRRSVGLQNVRERLERFYHGQATLTLTHRDDAPEGACAALLIPDAFLHETTASLAAQAREHVDQLRRGLRT